MFTRVFSALSVVATASAGVAQQQNVGAVQKVIQMLTDMSAKAKQERLDEQVAFARFTTWCDSQVTNLKDDIQKGAQEVESLTASVGKLGSDISAHGARLSELQTDQAKFEAEGKSTQAQREKDHTDFKAQEKDFRESVDAIEQALVILSRQAHDRPGDASAALLQASTVQQLPAQAQSLVSAFLGMMQENKAHADPLAYAPPQANAYEFQSGGVVELLKKLRDEFRDKLTEFQKEEMNSKHASDMILLGLTDSAENAAREHEETSILKEDKRAKLAAEKKQLKGTTTVKNDNEKQFSEVTVECREKKFSFEEKQNLRSEEIEAMGKAIEIMQSPDVLGMAEKHLGLAQSSKRVAKVLLQAMDAQAVQNEGVHFRVFDFLNNEGKRLHSTQLSMLAQKVMSDPFGKVRAMIEALITRMQDEAHQDAEHEAFCDKELGQSKITRDKLTIAIDSISAAIDDGKATILSLAEENAQLSKEVADLDQAMSEATDLRNKEKKANAETIKDATAAQAAVAAATAVLKDFYAKASTATAFVQAPPAREWGLKTDVKMGSEEWNSLANPGFEGRVDTGHKEGMATFGEVEQGRQDEAKYGVLGLLEVISSDFARLETETSASEAEAAQSYASFMSESKVSHATKSRQVELNTESKLSAEGRLQSNTADLQATQDQLLAANRYYDKLVPQCIDRGMTWDERVSARKAEIQSLKEALRILDGSDIA